ncbi:MFS transporter [Desulfosporosinus fructosivorans]
MLCDEKEKWLLRMEEKVMTTAKLTKFNAFTLLLIPFVWLFEASIIAPILGAVAAAFPGTSNFEIQLVMTMPFFTSIIFSVVAGRLAKSFDKKTLVIVGLFIYGVTGVLPAFANSITQILILRLITGVGVGLVLPLPGAIISEHYFEAKRERMLGLATAVANFANVVNSIAIGFILVLGWQYPFYSFGIVLVIMVIAIFGLPKSPPQTQVEPESKTALLNPKKSIPKIVFVFALFMTLNWVFFGFDILNTALFMMSEKLGAPWLIGIAISVPALGSIFSGSLFPELHRIFKGYLTFFALLIFALGFVVLSNAHSFSTLLVANLLIGFGSGIIPPFILYLTSNKVSPEQKDVSFGIVTSCIHLGFLAAPFIQVAIGTVSNNTSFRFLYFVSSIVLVTATVIFLFYGKKSKASGVAA